MAEVREVVRQVTGRAPLSADRSAQGALLRLTALHLGLHHGLGSFAGAGVRGVRSVWATTTVKRLRSLPVQPGPVVSIDAGTIRDPDGALRDVIASACADGWVRVWDARLMTLVAEIDMAPARPVGVRLAGSTNGGHLVVMDNAFGVWRGDAWGEAPPRLLTRVFPAPRGRGRTWLARAADGSAAHRMHVIWGRAEAEYETRVAELDLDAEHPFVSRCVLGGSPILGGDPGVGLWPYGGGRVALPPAAPGGSGDSGADGIAVVAVATPVLDELRLFDLEREASVGRVLMGSHRAVTKCRTVLCGRLDNTSVAVVGDHQGEIQIRAAKPDEDDGVTFAAQPTASFTGHFGAVKDLALATFGKREVLLSSGEDGAVHLWDPGSPHTAPRPTLFAGAITSLSVAYLPGGPGGAKTVVVAGDTAGNAGTTSVTSGRTVHFLPRREDGEVTGVATAVMPVAGAPRVLGATCSTDEEIRLFDVETGEAVGRPFGSIRMLTGGGHCQMSAIAAGALAGRSVVVAAVAGVYKQHRYDSLHVFSSQDWGVSARLLNEPLFGTLSGHPGPIPCVTLGTVNGRDVLITGCTDGCVRVWDGSSFEPAAPPLDAGSRAVYDVWVGELSGREVILAACGDGSLRSWDARTSTSLGPPVAAHTDAARGVGVAIGADGPVVVTTGRDATVRTWDPASWREYGPPHPLLHPGTALACTGPTTVVASGASLIRFELNVPPP